MSLLACFEYLVAVCIVLMYKYVCIVAVCADLCALVGAHYTLVLGLNLKLVVSVYGVWCMVYGVRCMLKKNESNRIQSNRIQSICRTGKNFQKLLLVCLSDLLTKEKLTYMLMLMLMLLTTNRGTPLLHPYREITNLQNLSSKEL